MDSKIKLLLMALYKLIDDIHCNNTDILTDDTSQLHSDIWCILYDAYGIDADIDSIDSWKNKTAERM